MDKPITVAELVQQLQRMMEMFPETKNCPVMYLDWNDYTWNVSEGIHDVYYTGAGTPDGIVLR